MNLRQIDLEVILNIDVRTIRRWESHFNPVSIENEFTLAEKLNIPFQVIHNLNANIPISYNLKTRRYSFSEYDTEILHFYPSAGVCETSNPRIKPITSLKEVNRILDYDHTIYDTDFPIKKDIILKASSILPGLNLIIKDYMGFYAGHLVTIPLKVDAYYQLREFYIIEGDLKLDNLECCFDEIRILYIYSVYADCPDNAVMLLRMAINYLKRIENCDDLLVAGYAVTNDGNEIAKKLGLKSVFENVKEYKDLRTETIPVFYEAPIISLIKTIAQ